VNHTTDSELARDHSPNFYCLTLQHVTSININMCVNAIKQKISRFPESKSLVVLFVLNFGSSSVMGFFFSLPYFHQIR